MARLFKHPMKSLAAAAILAGTMSSAQAIPVLQLYVEGATYDFDHESWVFDGANQPIRLWVIGNVAGPGSKGAIADVKLSIVYPIVDAPDGNPDVTVTIAPSTTAGYGGFTDPSMPSAPIALGTHDDGSLPVLGDGSTLAPHGTYGPGFEWQEFALGDFAATDSPIGDFYDTFPTAPSVTQGQINAYEVSFSGPSTITDFHFDAYDHVVAGNHAKYVFAPFSHDAGTGINSPVPEPGTLLLIGLGAAGLGFRLRRRR